MSDVNIKHEPKYPVQVLLKAMEIVELLANETSSRGLGISEIADSLKIGRSTVHRILDTLISFDYIEKAKDTNRYRLGWGLFKTGQVVPKHHDIVDIDVKILEEVCNQFHETINFGIRADKDIVVIAKYEPERNLRAIYQIGGREPIHATAMGKILLSEVAEPDVRILMKNYEFQKYTPNTITNIEDYLREINKARGNGYATDNEEFSIGISCIAIPIRNFAGEIVAALSASVPTIRLDPAIQIKIVEGLKDAGKIISRHLGYK